MLRGCCKSGMFGAYILRRLRTTTGPCWLMPGPRWPGLKLRALESPKRGVTFVLYFLSFDDGTLPPKSPTDPKLKASPIKRNPLITLRLQGWKLYPFSGSKVLKSINCTYFGLSGVLGLREPTINSYGKLMNPG